MTVDLLLTSEDIQKTRTTPYSPKFDGLVERFNRTFIQILLVCAEENFYNWDGHLPYLLTGYRFTEYSSTKCTPSLLMLGRDLMIGEIAVEILYRIIKSFPRKIDLIKI